MSSIASFGTSLLITGFIAYEKRIDLLPDHDFAPTRAAEPQKRHLDTDLPISVPGAAARLSFWQGCEPIIALSLTDSIYFLPENSLHLHR